jgi:undecaprenyl-diphosphatase
VVPSLAVTDTQPRRAHSPARLLEQALLGLALLTLIGALVVGVVPVTNPGVQACGSPFVFSWRTTNDVVLPAPGSPSAPPNVEQLLAQEPCHQRVDSRLAVSGLLVLVTVVAGLPGAVIGLIDDRAGYRASPRFESFLRERPDDAPSDPWDQPVVPVHDLGRRLPDIEWREVRVVLWVGLAAVVVLAWLAPWSAVRSALGDLQPGWILMMLVLVALTYPIAAAGVVAATYEHDRASTGFVTTLGTSVASSFTGRLLPEYGPAGLAVHQLVRAGQDRGAALERMTAVESVAPIVHGVVVFLVGVAALGVGQAAGDALSWQWAVWLLLLVGVVVGLVDAPRRYATLVVRPSYRALTVIVSRSDGAARLGGIVAAAIGLALVNALVVLAAARAVGSDASSGPVLLVGLLVAVVVVVAPTPDGAGMVEVALTLGLVWAGLDAGAAVAAMVLVRIVTLWLPMLPGWYALRRLERADAL